MIDYTDAGRRDMLGRANDLMGFAPGAEVELLGRDEGALLTGTMDNRRKVFVTVPYGKEVRHRRRHWWQRDTYSRASTAMTVYYIRVKATGAVVPLSTPVTAVSGNTITVSAP